MNATSYSRLSYVAIKVETTENTAVTPDTFVPFMSEDIVTEYQPTPAMPVSANRTKNLRPVKVAIPAPTGNISLLLEPRTIGHFLRGIFGTVTSGRYAAISGVTGTFQVGETITGGSSSATATVIAVSDQANYLLIGTPTGTFTDGETITGGTSSASATLAQVDTSVYGHEFKAPQSSLPTFTVEFGYANEAIRYTGVRFNALNSVGQSDNIVTAENGVIARGEFKHAKVTAITTSGAGSKTITVDQTTGLVAGDSVKVWREGTGFLDFSAASVKTHTIDSITSETAFVVTNLETSLAVGDRIVIAPQTPSYSISNEFFWIGGSVAKVAATADALIAASATCIEDFELNLTNEIEPRHCATGINFINRFPSNNYLKGIEAGGRINKTYGDINLLTKLRDNTAQAIGIKHTGGEIGTTGQYYSLDWVWPNVQYNNFNPSISEDALLEQEVEFTGFYSSSDGYLAKAVLVNDVTSY